MSYELGVMSWGVDAGVGNGEYLLAACKFQRRQVMGHELRGWLVVEHPGFR